MSVAIFRLGVGLVLGKTLHEYDLALCDYALGNVRMYLDQPLFSESLKELLSPPSLLGYLLGEDDPWVPQERLLLNDEEFDHLFGTIDGNMSLDRSWVAHEPLHRRHIDIIQDVRGGLSRQAAEDWSSACGEFAGRLEGRRLSLGEGIGIVHDWTRCLRRYLKAMGATGLLPHPEGSRPTPTSPRSPLERVMNCNSEGDVV